MKARVKATGEIVEVIAVGDYINENGQIIGEYKYANGMLHTSYELDFYIEEGITIPDYWTRLEHQYAGMAMQGILSNEDMQKELMRVFGKEEAIEDTIVDYARDMAQLLVKKMKEEMK